MPSETSNALTLARIQASGDPAQDWIVLGDRDPDDYVEVATFVRRDLVVPTVDEIADALVAVGGHPGRSRSIDRDAEAIRALLLSRIEGDTDGQ